jgi:hypothetical protein
MPLMFTVFVDDQRQGLFGEHNRYANCDAAEVQKEKWARGTCSPVSNGAHRAVARLLD